MKRQALRVDAGGNCVVGRVHDLPRLEQRTEVRRVARARAAIKPTRITEDPAPWVMRVLALALVLFVLLLLVLHG